jgi:hypothetical protein
MTGRGAGYCSGYDRPGYENQGAPPDDWPAGRRNRAFWRGRRGGIGFGFRNRWWPRRDFGTAPEGEQEWLQNRAEELRDELDHINTRINDLNSSTSEGGKGENE